jgi:hypothetical protein
MAVQYHNGQLYDVWPGGMAGVNNVNQYALNKGLGMGYANPIGNYTGDQAQMQPQQQGASMYQDPFGTAMSGTKSGTLQPFINRNTQQASNALYGGLLGYQPQSLVAGDAGGTPQNSMVPNWRLPSAIPQPHQAQMGLLGPNQPMFGNRSWMGAQ